MIFSFWRKWHPRVNKWDGMRPKSPNSIHRAWLLCHIPPIRAMSGAKSYLANPMGFAVTLTSPSCPLSSPRLHLLATYHCVGFRERLYHSPSSLSIACVLHSSSLFVVGIYSLILQCKSPFAIAYANIELCLNNPSMPHLCTSHHLKTQLQFPLPSVLFTGIVVGAIVDVLFAIGLACCFGSIYYVHFRFSDAQPICYSWWFVGLLSSSWINNMGFWGGCAHFVRMASFGGSPHARAICKRGRKKYTKSTRASVANAKVERSRVKLQHCHNTLLYYASSCYQTNVRPLKFYHGVWCLQWNYIRIHSALWLLSPGWLCRCYRNSDVVYGCSPWRSCMLHRHL